MYSIFGKVEKKLVMAVGCSRSADLPEDCILLQEVEHRPEVHWVKWSVRFRRTLSDKKALSHPFAAYFKNPARLKRLLGDEDLSLLAKELNVKFLKFHEKNAHLLDELLQAALTKKAEGREEYSVDQLLGDARWGDTEISMSDDKVKVNHNWSAWYARVLQMVEPKLIGFFAVRSSLADDLVWIDGTSWQEFASQREEEINWDDPFSKLPHNDWEYEA